MLGWRPHWYTRKLLGIGFIRMHMSYRIDFLLARWWKRERTSPPRGAPPAKSSALYACNCMHVIWLVRCKEGLPWLVAARMAGPNKRFCATLMRSTFVGCAFLQSKHVKYCQVKWPPTCMTLGLSVRRRIGFVIRIDSC